MIKLLLKNNYCYLIYLSIHKKYSNATVVHIGLVNSAALLFLIEEGLSLLSSQNLNPLNNRWELCHQ